MRSGFNPSSSSCAAGSRPAAPVATISTCAASGPPIRGAAGELASASGSYRMIIASATGTTANATRLGPGSARVSALSSGAAPQRPDPRTPVPATAVRCMVRRDVPEVLTHLLHRSPARQRPRRARMPQVTVKPPGSSSAPPGTRPHAQNREPQSSSTSRLPPRMSRLRPRTQGSAPRPSHHAPE